MPTLDQFRRPENVTYAQQEAAEEAAQAAGSPPSMPPDILSTVSAPGSDSGLDTGLEEPLARITRPTGLIDVPQLCRDRETLLVFKESEEVFRRSGSFDVKDSDGNVVIAVKGRAMSLHETKDVMSADGETLFVIRTKMARRRTFEGVSEGGKHLFEIRNSPTGMECEFSNMGLSFEHDAHGVLSLIYLRGNFHDGAGDLVLDGQTLAQVRHSVMGGHALVRDDQTYYVKVAAGVDLSLIGAICLCFDQLREVQGS